MSIMNELLADIVEASGGTVTTPNNRNQLLQDWLSAVGGDSRQYLNFNGMSYGEIATAELEIGATIKLQFVAPTSLDGSNNSLFWNDDGNVLFIRATGADDTWAFGGASFFLDGQQISFGDPVPLDGQLHVLEAVTNTASNVAYVGARNNLAEGFSSIIYDVALTGITNTDVYPTGTAFWPIANGFTDSHITPDVNNPDSADFYVDAGTLNNWADARGAGVLSVEGDFVKNTAVGTAAFGSSYMLTGLTVGTSYFLNIRSECSEPSATVRIRFDTLLGLVGGELISSTGAAEYSGYVTATATEMYVGDITTGQVAGDTVTVTKLSLVKSTAMQLFNDLPEDWVEELP